MVFTFLSSQPDHLETKLSFLLIHSVNIYLFEYFILLAFKYAASPGQCDLVGASSYNLKVGGLPPGQATCPGCG